MTTINIHTKQGIKAIQGKAGDSLLATLRNNNYSVYAPCGGKGTCGKCRVNIQGQGSVLSCMYFPERDIDISLPEINEAQILVNQSEYLKDYAIEHEAPDMPAENEHGIAIDIGTTTVVMYFVELATGRLQKLASFLNPQNSFGADVIARINYCQQDEDGLEKQRKSIVEAINRELEIFKKQKQLGTRDITKMTVAGNTTMLHILCGINPRSIALAPFTPTFTEKQVFSGRETDFEIDDNAVFITLPNIAAYVGADIVAGLTVLKSPYKNYIFLDVGTNGEMALVYGDQIITCATAAGPAFEGANLSCGMGAVRGAISVFEEPGKLSVIGDSQPQGICGSGIVDILAYMLRNGIVDETGLLKEDYTISEEDKIYVTQDDIREIQLAKSAIISGIKTMINIAEMDYSDIDALFLAGGFGNYINKKSAIEIGLLPRELENKIHAIGNSAGMGALQYLKSSRFAEETEMIVERTEYVELSGNDDFTLEFAMNMNFIV